MLLAVLFSGAVARRLKPGAGIVSVYILVVDVLLLACFAASLLLGCQQLSMAGTPLPNGELNLVNECNSRCSCSTDVFEPVCGPDEETNYFSPCFAGMSQLQQLGQQAATGLPVPGGTRRHHLRVRCKCGILLTRVHHVRAFRGGAWLGEDGLRHLQGRQRSHRHQT
ncbi:hypothetical protein MTO96_006495 [Rhipicephalus appendiculatus]